MIEFCGHVLKGFFHVEEDLAEVACNSLRNRDAGSSFAGAVCADERPLAVV
jgi:hypothetical protein